MREKMRKINFLLGLVEKVTICVQPASYPQPPSKNKIKEAQTNVAVESAI